LRRHRRARLHRLHPRPLHPLDERRELRRRSRIVPSSIPGQRKAPCSSRLANRQRPEPSHQISFTRSARLARKTNTVPEKGSAFRYSCTSAARPSMPLRKSTGLVATSTRTGRLGTITVPTAVPSTTPGSSPAASAPEYVAGRPSARSRSRRRQAAPSHQRSPARSSMRASVRARPPRSTAALDRRQRKICAGVSPCARATALTLAPGAVLSATIRALSSALHARRCPAPVKISTRRAGAALVLGSSAVSVIVPMASRQRP